MSIDLTAFKYLQYAIPTPADWHSGRELCRSQLISYGHFAHIRLVGFNSSLVGYLEICRDGAWKTVTTNDGEWGRKEATVVCRELGYLDAITFSHIEGYI